MANQEKIIHIGDRKITIGSGGGAPNLSEPQELSQEEKIMQMELERAQREYSRRHVPSDAIIEPSNESQRLTNAHFNQGGLRRLYNSHQISYEEYQRLLEENGWI